MGQKPADENMANSVGVVDDIGKETIKAQKEHFLKEIDTFESNLKRRVEGKERMRKQWEVDKELWEIQLKDDNHMRIESLFKFEEDARYNELRKMKLQWKFEEDTHMADSQLKQADVQLEQLQEQIDSAKKALAELEGDLNE